MDIKNFIQQLEAEFEDIPPNTLSAVTSFKDLEDWSSMHALILIALVDTEYDVTLSGDELMACHTVIDLFNLVKEKSTTL